MLSWGLAHGGQLVVSPCEVACRGALSGAQNDFLATLQRYPRNMYQHKAMAGSGLFWRKIRCEYLHLAHCAKTGRLAPGGGAPVPTY